MNNTTDIDEKANDLLKSVFGDVDGIKLPIDLNEIAQYCDLKVLQGSFKDKDVEGALDRGSKTVYLSEDDTFDRKNFTLAHELGHLKLHSEVSTELFFMHQLTDLDLLVDSEDEKEAAADQFAAALLIPEQALKSLRKVNKNTIDLARIFGVPPAVMRYRLKKLGVKA